MKNIFLLFFILTLYKPCDAQWNLLEHLYTTQGINTWIDDVMFTCADTGIYSSGGSTSSPHYYYVSCKYTTDACNSWINIQDGLDGPDDFHFYHRFYKVRNTNIIYAITGEPYISLEKSCDGGITWSYAQGTVGTGIDLFPIDSNTYFTFENKFLKKIKVHLYTSILDSFADCTPQLIYFPDTMNGFILAIPDSTTQKCEILKTTQGGIGWNVVYEDTLKNFNCINFPSVRVGYVAGDNGVVLKTIDNGLTWNELNIGFTNRISTMDFFNDSVGIIAGDSGFAMTTVDGGNTWHVENTGFTTDIKRVFCLDDSIIYVYATDASYYQSNVYWRILNPVSVKEINTLESLTIFPNPATTSFAIRNILTTQHLQLELMNPLGDVIFSTKLFGMKEYLIESNFGKGVYFVKVFDDKKSICKKLIIE